jgi:hypothetical protein
MTYYRLTITHVCSLPHSFHVDESLQGFTRYWIFVKRTEAMQAYSIACIAHGHDPNQSFGRNTAAIQYQDSALSVTIRLEKIHA